MSDRDDGERHFAVAIEAEQSANLRVDESGDDARGKLQRVCNCEHVGEDRAVVPSKMTVSAGAVFPRIPPVSARANDDDRRMSYGGVVGSSLHQSLPEIAGAKL